MIYRVTHRTTYRYREPVSLCYNLAHLSPLATARQEPCGSHLEIDPRPAIVTHFTDYFGNQSVYFAVQEPHQELTVTARQTVEVLPAKELDPRDSLPWEEARERLPAILEASPFIYDSPLASASSELREYAAPSFPRGRALLEGVRDLTGRIHADFRYDAAATTVSTPMREVLERRRGVCQDFAHLAIGCLRSLGLSARYVSGYLRTEPPPGQERLVGADASHAWFSVHAPGRGWVDFDPTNDLVPSDGHIVLAWGRDFEDVSPLKGVILGGGEHRVEVSVDVAPV